MTASYIETYPALDAVDGLVHGFICRDPQIDVKTDRETAIARLEPHFDRCFAELGIGRDCLALGEQVHGAHVQLCGAGGAEGILYPETDGIATSCGDQYLGVYVADCGAVYLVDPVQRVCALVHSGKKGTEQKIAVVAIQLMQQAFGSRVEDIIVQLAPCIRPPHYEIDFAAQIQSDCLAAGIQPEHYHDCGISTATDLERYYSYRIEKGQTGRLMAVMGFSK